MQTPSSFFLPIPIFIQEKQVFIRQFSFEDGLCPGIYTLAGKGQSESITDGFQVHFLVGDATLHRSHSGYQLHEAFRIHPSRRLRKILITTEAREFQNRMDISLCIVLRGRCPSMDDVHYIVRLLGAMKIFPIRLQYLPCRPITVCQRFELHETRVCLLYPCSLPPVRRPADVERIVVSDSSVHSPCF